MSYLVATLSVVGLLLLSVTSWLESKNTSKLLKEGSDAKEQVKTLRFELEIARRRLDSHESLTMFIIARVRGVPKEQIVIRNFGSLATRLSLEAQALKRYGRRLTFEESEKEAEYSFIEADAARAEIEAALFG